MPTKPLQGQQLRWMRAMIMNCVVNYDEACIQDKVKDQMMLQQNESVLSSQECVVCDAEMLLTIVQSNAGPKIQKYSGSKIQVTQSQKVDTRGIQKEGTQVWPMKVRWSDLETIKGTNIKTE